MSEIQTSHNSSSSMLLARHFGLAEPLLEDFFTVHSETWNDIPVVFDRTQEPGAVSVEENGAKDIADFLNSTLLDLDEDDFLMIAGALKENPFLTFSIQNALADFQVAGRNLGIEFPDGFERGFFEELTEKGFDSSIFTNQDAQSQYERFETLSKFWGAFNDFELEFNDKPNTNEADYSRVKGEIKKYADFLSHIDVRNLSQLELKVVERTIAEISDVYDMVFHASGDDQDYLVDNQIYFNPLLASLHIAIDPDNYSADEVDDVEINRRKAICDSVFDTKPLRFIFGAYALLPASGGLVGFDDVVADVIPSLNTNHENYDQVEVDLVAAKLIPNSELQQAFKQAILAISATIKKRGIDTGEENIAQSVLNGFAEIQGLESLRFERV